MAIWSLWSFITASSNLLELNKQTTNQLKRPLTINKLRIETKMEMERRIWMGLQIPLYYTFAHKADMDIDVFSLTYWFGHHLSSPSPFVGTHVFEHKIPSFKAGNSSYLWWCGGHGGREFTILFNVWNLDSVILEYWFQVHSSKLSCHSYITCSLYTENAVQWSKPKPEPSFKVKEMKIFWCTGS